MVSSSSQTHGGGSRAPYNKKVNEKVVAFLYIFHCRQLLLHLEEMALILQSSNQMTRRLLLQKQVNLLLELWCGVERSMQVKLLASYL